jgi:hypothetical protein
MRLTREAARISALGVGLLLASLVSAAAQDPHTEIFTGLEASNNAITGYLGAGYAFGKGLYERGWRIRAVGALGRYDYRGTLSAPAPISVRPSTARRATALRFSATSSVPKSCF